MKLLNLLSFLPRRRRTAVPPALPAVSTSDTGAPVQDEEPPLHICGWFDSSHDLHQGLCVHEHSSTDSVARELSDLPLASWLELQLSGWRVIQAA